MVKWKSYIKLNVMVFYIAELIASVSLTEKDQIEKFVKTLQDTVRAEKELEKGPPDPYTVLYLAKSGVLGSEIIKIYQTFAEKFHADGEMTIISVRNLSNNGNFDTARYYMVALVTAIQKYVTTDNRCFRYRNCIEVNVYRLKLDQVNKFDSMLIKQEVIESAYKQIDNCINETIVAQLSQSIQRHFIARLYQQTKIHIIETLRNKKSYKSNYIIAPLPDFHLIYTMAMSWIRDYEFVRRLRKKILVIVYANDMLRELYNTTCALESEKTSHFKLFCKCVTVRKFSRLAGFFSNHLKHIVKDFFTNKIRFLILEDAFAISSQNLIESSDRIKFDDALEISSSQELIESSTDATVEEYSNDSDEQSSKESTTDGSVEESSKGSDEQSSKESTTDGSVEESSKGSDEQSSKKSATDGSVEESSKGSAEQSSKESTTDGCDKESSKGSDEQSSKGAYEIPEKESDEINDETYDDHEDYIQRSDTFVRNYNKAFLEINFDNHMQSALLKSKIFTYAIKYQPLYLDRSFNIYYSDTLTVVNTMAFCDVLCKTRIFNDIDKHQSIIIERGKYVDESVANNLARKHGNEGCKTSGVTNKTFSKGDTLELYTTPKIAGHLPKLMLKQLILDELLVSTGVEDNDVKSGRKEGFNSVMIEVNEYYKHQLDTFTVKSTLLADRIKGLEENHSLIDVKISNKYFEHLQVGVYIIHQNLSDQKKRIGVMVYIYHADDQNKIPLMRRVRDVGQNLEDFFQRLHFYLLRLLIISKAKSIHSDLQCKTATRAIFNDLVYACEARTNAKKRRFWRLKGLE